MSIVRIALAASALAAGIATAVVAQPTPAPTNPNTKVYAYKKTAPPTANPSPAASSNTGAIPSQIGRMDPDVPAYGSAKWWEEKNRIGHGSGD